jgi:hypothetical protein
MFPGSRISTLSISPLGKFGELGMGELPHKSPPPSGTQMMKGGIVSVTNASTGREGILPMERRLCEPENNFRPAFPITTIEKTAAIALAALLFQFFCGIQDTTTIFSPSRTSGDLGFKFPVAVLPVS